MGAGFDPISLGMQAAQNVGSIASGLLGAGVGLFQRRQAKKILRDNPYPTYNIPQEVFENQRIARENAGSGMPSEQYNQAMRNINRQQANALFSSSTRRGGLSLIPRIQQSSNDALLNLDAKNAEMRLQNQRTLYNINNQVAGYRDKAWDWNTREKYDRNYNYGMALKGAANQNIIGGFDKLISGGTRAASQYGPMLGGGGYGRANNASLDAEGMIPGY